MKSKYKSVLVTGGSGFIGSHFVHFLLGRYYDVKVVNVDVLSYAGNSNNVKDVKKNSRYKFYRTNIGDYDSIMQILKKEKIDLIVNFAAESDNNRALRFPVDFALNNSLKTAILLEAARIGGVKRFHQISTCEVFGEMSLNSKSSFTEKSPFLPTTPYNASKAAANHFVNSYFHTFGLPVTVSHCSNNYGPNQFPEKVIPVFITNALNDKPLPVFKSSGNKREWIHVLDHCEAIDFILRKGTIGESYNIGSGLEKTIDQLAGDILKILKKPATLKKIIPDRLSHDSRYLLNSGKIRKLGWKPKISWVNGLPETIEWYKKNEGWWLSLLKKTGLRKKKVR